MLKNKMKKVDIKDSLNLMTLILVVVVGGAAFFGGVKYQENKSSQAMMGQFATNPFDGRSQLRNMGQTGGNTKSNTTAQTGVGERRMGNGQIMGEITSVDANSITIKGNDGNSRIILLSDKTMISKASAGQISDLKVGEKVSAFGTPNTDGSISGANIQLNPTMTGNSPSGTPSGTPIQK